jgi:asparagine synthase (glutamine-hydrolysing)
MCSIAGIISSQSRVTERLDSALEKMKASLRHRGPDDSGTYRTKSGEFSVGLANTRLAIIDLSSDGHQPMHDEQSGLTITYNGEVYNFQQLRKQLNVEQDKWLSQTDTEVVLRAYKKWGVSSFARLRGMFAFAIWDESKRELLLVRDAFGIKPLYFYFDGLTLLFASEVRALLKSDLVPRRLSIDGAASFLEYGSVQAPASIIEGVRSVMPGNYFLVRQHGATLQIEVGSYLDFPELEPSFQDPVNNVSCSRAEAITVVREKLKESVQAHLVSDVPLGVFLSGGMDSSALVALIHEVSHKPANTFSVVFDEQQFSESSYASFIANRFATNHQEIHLTEHSLLEMLPAAIAAIDQPTIDGLNSYVVSKAVKDAGMTVALSGLGGDELFAGYPSFRRALKMQGFSSFSKSLMRWTAEIGRGAFNGSVQQRKFLALAASDCSPKSVYSISRQLFSDQEREGLIGDQTFLTETKHPGVTQTASDPVNAMSRLELQGYMANTLLRDSDFMSMAHSLEVRVPFVDIEVARCVLRLPGSWKLNGSRPKPLLADVIGDRIPAKFFQRAKMGFTLPFAKWMLSSLRREIDQTLSNQVLVAQSGLRQSQVTQIWKTFLARPSSIGWSRPWALYVLAKWCQNNDIKAPDVALGLF